MNRTDDEDDGERTVIDCEKGGGRTEKDDEDTDKDDKDGKRRTYKDDEDGGGKTDKDELNDFK